ncbi:unnamed protein product [Adineta ricciae]|uniref:Uncharacterized protein n=1 Tax=Adineta ricciae TaxID=249248 RepID=A0A814A9Z1_ADIRI|nr:unnamed protein product [Adineta ricciae]CAF1584917.1 unnamed protein product [Adineta ricciae]
MQPMRKSVLHVFLLCWLLSVSDALECRTCDKIDPSCDTPSNDYNQVCDDENSVCYSWFHRGAETNVQRGCMSTISAEYKLIQETIGHRNEGCVKRMRTFDCFKFCSRDACN